MKTVGLHFTVSLRKLAFLLIVLVTVGTGPVSGAYLRNVPQTITQPDGSVLRCFATGDEFYHWLHDANNFTIVQDPSTGFFVYAKMQAGQLQATALIAGKDDPARAGLNPGENLAPEQVIELSRTAYRAPSLKGGSVVNTTGTINNIVIFIRFSDQPEFSDPVTKYSTAFNATGTSSMVEYFREVSGSQLTINTSFFPMNGGATVASYQDPMTRGYYSKHNSSTNTAGYQTDIERYDRENALLRSAVESVKSQIESTGLDYDIDNNGQVDNVCFIVQGATDGWADLLWPHMFMLYASEVTIGGARVWNYNLQLSETFGVHILCHEMSHSLGFPDLYRYTNNSINPVGPWDVMSSTTNPPQHHTVYTKVKYGNWSSVIPEITTAGNYSLKPLSSDPFAAYKIASPNSTSEYFVVEYRKASGMFESQLLGSGLVIYRVNPSMNGNSYGPPDELYICRPDGTVTNDGNLAQAFYSSNAGRTAFGGTSATSCFLSNGAPGGFQITNIGNAGENITFTVSFGNTPPPVLAISPESREAANSAGTATFSISNTGSGTMTWNAAVTTGSNWARISSGSNGTNTGTLTISYDANTLTTTRTAVITVTAADATGSPKTITITQAAAVAPVLTITPEARSFEAEGGSFSFAISNTGGGSLNWTAAVTGNANWAHITSGASGINAGSIVLVVDANNTTSNRTATITVSANGSTGSPKTITITQAAAEVPVLSVTPETRSFGAEGGSFSFSVSNAGSGSLNWTAAVDGNANWAQITTGAAGTNSGSIVVVVNANSSNSVRTATISVAANGSTGNQKTLTLTQAGQVIELVAGPETRNVPSVAGNTTFSVANAGQGNMNWTAAVTTGAGWAHITSGSAGINEGTIQVSFDANTESQIRTAQITVSTSDGGSSSKIVSIVQEASVPVLYAGPETQTLPIEGGSTSFLVSNLGSGNLYWTATVTSGTDWAQISEGQNGTNSGTITLVAGENPFGEIREAEITISDNQNSNSWKTVKVIQAANPPVLQVDRSHGELTAAGGTATFTIANAGGGNLRWTASVANGAGWAKIISGEEGTNAGTIVVEANENRGLRRTATILVSTIGSENNPVTLNLIQEEKIAELEIDPDIQSVDYSGANLHFGITIDGPGTVTWTAEISSGESWVHITSGTNGINDGEITVEVDKNEGDPRTAIIVVNSPEAAEPRIITINQDIANGISELKNEQQMTVYPNPSVKDFTVQLENFNGMQKKLEIINLMGQLEAEQILTDEQTLIDCSNLEKGIYFFRVISENQEITVKRVIKN